MGISISMEISKATTKEEWTKVYNETLEIIKNFPFAEKRYVDIHGIECYCLTPTIERKREIEWFHDSEQVGWTTIGDYESMCTAEEYYLSRNLIKENVVDVAQQDAIWGALPAYCGFDWNDERCNQTYSIWGAKTQGEPYHIYLLAVAVLIEARLGIKAFTYGDITRGQLKKAVEIVNEYVDDKIDLPDRCYIDRLYDRLHVFDIDEEEKLQILNSLFLGNKDIEFGEFIRKHFQADARKKYWKSRFKRFDIDMIGFDNVLQDYLEWGFELEELGHYIKLKNKCGKKGYGTLIDKIMETELHHEHKDCKDSVKIDQNQEQPYGVGTLFAQIFLAGAKNPRIDRYIPLEEMRIQLEKAFGNKCNVNKLIDKYLKKEQDTTDKKDSATMLNQVMDEYQKSETEIQEKYNISDYEDLRYYKDGDTIHPQLAKSVGASRRVLDSFSEKEEIKMLMSKDTKQKCKWLIDQNEYILIRDVDWDKVFTDIEDNPNSFLRYCAIMCAKVDSHELVELCVGLFVNDELYAASARWAAEAEEINDKY